MDILRFAFLGLGTGAVIASIALGLVLTYRASGVVNFAQGAMASWTAYTYYSLTTEGSVPLLPLPGLPAGIPLGGPWPAAWALVGSLIVAALLALVLYGLVFRPLRQAPALAKIAASVGVMIALQAALVIRFGFRNRQIDPVVPDDPITWLGISLGADRYILLGLVVVITIALSLLFTRTRFGLATRAAAESERSATLLGVSPTRIAAVNWVIAAVLGGLMGIVASAITGLTPSLLTLVIVPALAVALVAGFRSFAIAAAFGIILGMTQSTILLAEVRLDWFPKVGLGTALPFLVIAAVMLLTGRALPDRGAADSGALPPAYAPLMNRPRIIAQIVLILGVLGLAVFAPFEVRGALNNSLIGTVLALSVVVVTGFVGQISLAQMCLAGLGAFAVATFGTDLGLGLLITLPAAIAVGVIAGLLFGLPSLRTRGASLAILTLAAGVALQQLVLTQNNWLGSSGTRQAPVPSIGALELGTQSPFPFGIDTIPSPAFGLLLVVVTTAAAYFVMRLRRTTLGAQMLTVRANERAAAAAGVNVSAVKLAGFAIAAGLAGLGGALIAYNLGSFSAQPFDVVSSLILLAIVYLGGVSTVGGAVWAGMLASGGLFFLAQSQFYDAGPYTGYVAGLGLILTAVMYPQGIDGATRESVLALLRRLRPGGRRHATTPQASGVTS